ncbi:MAG: hypothetical protein RLZZ107_1343, partial [Bacteroidota bacterium]
SLVINNGLNFNWPKITVLKGNKVIIEVECWNDALGLCLGCQNTD